MRHTACFHSHIPPFIDVDTLVMHTWEGSLDDNLLFDYLDAIMEAIDGGHMRRRGDIFLSLCIFLRTSKDFGGEDCNVPKF